MAWARDVFVRGAKLYELVLEGMWEKGEEDALAISGLLQEAGLDRCRILDVPCGIGRVGIPLAQLGFSVTGVDYSPHLVQVASSKARSAGLGRKAAFSTGEMSRLHSNFKKDSFDCAINVFTSIGYGSVQDDLEFFRSLRKVVRKGGLFVISGLRNRDYVAGHPVQNIYEESEDLLVLDSYSFDVSSSRERGTWRFYAKVEDAMKLIGVFPTDIRVYSPHELVSMLGSSGWAVSGVYEAVSTKREFTTDSPVYSAVAEAL